MKYLLLEKNNPVRGGSIHLPGSKSIGNRLLMLRALSKNSFHIENLSEADDTRIMQQALHDIAAGKKVIHAGEAGTAARFLTAYLALLGKPHILTGAPRLLQRPMAPLVEALQNLGARITYLNQKGCLPLEFRGGKLRSATIEVPAGFSSQYFSALLMIAPLLPDGLTLKAGGRPVSLPYIDMTIDLMRQGGAQIISRTDEWTVLPGEYAFPEVMSVEADWSAAAPWLVFGLWAAPVALLLEGLTPHSLQGDSAGLRFFYANGYHTFFSDKGLNIETRAKCSLPAEIEYDFTPTPDLALSFITAAAACGCRGTFSGLQTLSLKESDRFLALIHELAGFGIKVEPVANHTLKLHGGNISRVPPVVKTYNDHRMPMAFAPLVLLTGRLCIENPGVVAKSYPQYWNHLADRGINLTFHDTIPAF